MVLLRGERDARPGRVLVAGGGNDTGFLTSAELYNRLTGTWRVTGSMNQARSGFTATLLTDGKVLAAGGSRPPGIGGVVQPDQVLAVHSGS